MAKKYRVTLTDDERQHLENLTQRRSKKAAPVRRAFLLLKADQGPAGPAWPDHQIAESFNVTIRTVERLRQRFVEDGFDRALYGKKREPKPKAFDARVEAHVVALRCSDPPEGYARWSMRLLADQMVELDYVESISHESVRQLLKKTPSSPGA